MLEAPRQRPQPDTTVPRPIPIVATVSAVRRGNRSQVVDREPSDRATDPRSERRERACQHADERSCQLTPPTPPPSRSLSQPTRRPPSRSERAGRRAQPRPKPAPRRAPTRNRRRPESAAREAVSTTASRAARRAGPSAAHSTATRSEHVAATAIDAGRMVTAVSALLSFAPIAVALAADRQQRVPEPDPRGGTPTAMPARATSARSPSRASHHALRPHADGTQHGQRRDTRLEHPSRADCRRSGTRRRARTRRPPRAASAPIASHAGDRRAVAPALRPAAPAPQPRSPRAPRKGRHPARRPRRTRLTRSRAANAAARRRQCP